MKFMASKSTFTHPITKQKLTEAEYVDWLHSPEGREHEHQAMLKASNKPVIEIETPITPQAATQIMKATGAKLHVRKGFTQTPDDQAVIQAIINRAAQKTTQAISIRIPTEDLEAAKRLAEKPDWRISESSRT